MFPLLLGDDFMLFLRDSDHSCSEETDWSFIIIQLKLRLNKQMCLLAQMMLPTMIGIDMIMSVLLIMPLRTQIHLIRKSYYINPLKKILLGLKYRCLISVFV